MELVEHYLEIERERFEERLRVAIDVPAALRALPGAVPAGAAAGGERRQARHRAAPIHGGEVRVEARLDASTGTQMLVLVGRATPARRWPRRSTRADRRGRADQRRTALAGHYGARRLADAVGGRGVTTAEVRLPAGAGRRASSRARGAPLG